MKKAVLFIPFWGQAGHVGNHRVERFVRWLYEDDYQVVIIQAGARDEYHETPLGLTLAVRDPLGRYRENSRDKARPSPDKKNTKILQWLAHRIFNPDSGILWARAAARHANVIKVATGAEFILSSSPPESSHVGAWLLSRRLDIPHIVDMRDGWLDETLKPILLESAFRRWSEGRIESRILSNARKIFVTSNVWYELLRQRYPVIAGKIAVLTNGYPINSVSGGNIRKPVSSEQGIVLIHAGRFLESRLTQLPDLLLDPLLAAIRQSRTNGVVKLIGPLTEEELDVIGNYKNRFEESVWRIECPGFMQRDQLLKELQEANGLLLLSASPAPIPAKLFEYIPTGRPMLVVTERNSATWRICEKLPQACLVDFKFPCNESISRFADLICKESIPSIMPEHFYEVSLSKTFNEVIKKIYD
jgi:glycosyltransferase involved in cell wall biosynthesis